MLKLLSDAINLQARLDQEIPPEPVPAVLPRVRQGHRLPEAGLVLKFQP